MLSRLSPVRLSGMAASLHPLAVYSLRREKRRAETRPPHTPVLEVVPLRGDHQRVCVPGYFVGVLAEPDVRKKALRAHSLHSSRIIGPYPSAFTLYQVDDLQRRGLADGVGPGFETKPQDADLTSFQPAPAT